MVYFPDEVFRNIASYLTDPYKAEKEKHASVWQRIRVKRESRIRDAYTEVESIEDEYFVYLKDGIPKCDKGFVPTIFYEDDHLQELDNLHEHIEYDDGDEDDEYHNYEFKQYQ